MKIKIFENSLPPYEDLQILGMLVKIIYMLKQIRQISRKQPEEYNFTLAELHLLQIKTTQAGIKPLKDRVTSFLIDVF